MAAKIAFITDTAKRKASFFLFCIKKRPIVLVVSKKRANFAAKKLKL